MTVVWKKVRWQRYASLIETCREGDRTVIIRHVNDVLIQPHWRSHEEFIKAEVDKAS